MDDLTSKGRNGGQVEGATPVADAATAEKKPEGSKNSKVMSRITGFIGGAVAGLAGAALFFLVAFLLNWGGLGEESQPAVIPGAPPQLSATPVSTRDTMGPSQIYDQYADSVVQIVSTFEQPSDFFHTGGEQQGIGSGFVVSDEGYILTNAHVVTTAGTGNGGTATKVTVHFKSGKQAEASIVGFDVTGSDIAVIKVDPTDLNLVPVAMGDSTDVQVGEPVVAIGSPFGVYDSSLTAGVVSAVERNVESPESGFVIQDAIQTDAAINRGNSGGPLFDSGGRVIGINEQIISESGGFEGVGFAVPINTAKRVMDEIIATGEVEYAWMGVVGQSIDEELASKKDLPVTEGALVSKVLSDGPSAKAGIEVGDIIIRFGDKDVKKMEDVTDQLLDYKPGDKVKVTVLRNGEEKELEIELGKRPASIQ